MSEPQHEKEVLIQTVAKLKRFRKELQHFKESFQILEDRVEDPQAKKVIAAFTTITNLRFLELTAKVRKITENLEEVFSLPDSEE